MGIILQLKRKAQALQSPDIAGVSTALDGQAIGSTVELYGPGGLVGTWVLTASGIKSQGWVNLLNADSSTGIGWTLGTSSAPTWATPGPNGGLVLPGDGDLLLDGLGEHDGAVLTCLVRGVLTLTTEVDGQQIGAGMRSALATASLGGACARAAGVWYRQFMIGDLGAHVIGGLQAVGYDMPGMVTGDIVSMFRSALIADAASGTGSYSAGAYRGDEAPASGNQQANASTSNALVQRDDQTLHLMANAAAGALTYRVTHAMIAGGQA